jgi:RNA polymerase sigma-70 factor (ECF subfamily)
MVSIPQPRERAPTVGPGEIEGAAEAALLRAGRAGDREALDQLLALHERSLLALCCGILGHVEDAEDAVQETFLRALRALPSFRGDAAFRTWLFRIAVNVCLKSKATRRHHEPLEEARCLAVSGTGSPEALALDHLQLQEALQRLLPRQRAILLLREREGWSAGKIAEGLGWSERQVRYELAKARRALLEWRSDADRGEAR